MREDRGRDDSHCGEIQPAFGRTHTCTFYNPKRKLKPRSATVPAVVTVLKGQTISWCRVTGYPELTNCLGNFLE